MIAGGFDAIVLAAGLGSRFGGQKLAADFRGRPVIHHVLDTALEASDDRVVLVVGAHSDLDAVLDRWEATDRGRLLVLTIAQQPPMLSVSLRTGIGAVRPDAEGAMVFLGDMPLIPRSITYQLKAAVRAGAWAAAPDHLSARGHPVALSRALFDAVSQLHGDAGAGALLKSLGAALALAPTDDPGVLFDIDQPHDLVR